MIGASLERKPFVVWIVRERDKRDNLSGFGSASSADISANNSASLISLSNALSYAISANFVVIPASLMVANVKYSDARRRRLAIVTSSSFSLVSLVCKALCKATMSLYVCLQACEQAPHGLGPSCNVVGSHGEVAMPTLSESRSGNAYTMV